MGGRKLGSRDTIRRSGKARRDWHGSELPKPDPDLLQWALDASPLEDERLKLIHAEQFVAMQTAFRHTLHRQHAGEPVTTDEVAKLPTLAKMSCEALERLKIEEKPPTAARATKRKGAASRFGGDRTPLKAVPK